MISKSYRKNKSVFWIPIAIVLVLSVLFLNLTVFSSDAPPERIVTFESKTWNIADQVSKPTWKTNSSNIEFTLDLKEDYADYIKKLTEENKLEETTITRPFNIVATYNGTAIGGINYSESSPEEKGKYLVDFLIPAEFTNVDGNLALTINFSGNAWGIPTEANTDFTIERDVTPLTVVAETKKDGKYQSLETDAVFENEAIVRWKIEGSEEEIESKNVIATLDGKEKKVDVKWDYKENAAISNDVKLTDIGDYVITVTAIDDVGNSTENRATFGLYKEDPRLSITETATPGFYNQKVTITINNDIKIREAYFDRGDGQQTPFSYKGKTASLEITDEGSHSIKVYIVDRKGEHSFTPQQFVIDTENPTVSIDGVEDNGIYDGSQKIKIIASDTNPNPSQTELRVTRDGTEVLKVKGSEALNNEHSFDKEGLYEAVATYTDKAGNTASETKNFKIDQSIPELSIGGVSDNAYYNKDVKVDFSVKDLTFDIKSTILKVTKDGILYSKVIDFIENLLGGGASHTFTEDGAYTVTLDSTDLLGNIAETKSINFTIDKTKPQVSVTGITDGKKYNGAIELAISATDKNLDNSKTVLTVTKDNKTMTYKGEDAHQPHSFTEEGEYIVNVDYFDKAGNKADFNQKSFIIDKTAPDLYIEGVNEGEFYNDEEKPVLFRVEDWNIDLDNIELTITKDNTDYSTEGIEFKKQKNRIAEAEHVFTKNGDYVVKLKSTDEAGNVAAEKQVSFTIDQTPPEIEFTNIGQNGRYSDDRNVTITVTDINMGESTATVKYNGESYKIDPFVLDGQMATTNHKFTQEGVYELQVVSTDKAGNVKTETRKFTVDKTGPAIKYSIEDGKYFKDNKVSLTVTVDDYTPFVPEITVKNGETPVEVPTNGWVEKIKWLITQELTITLDDEGVYSVEVEAKDYFGAVSKEDLRFTIDRQEPKIVISGNIPNEGFVQKNNELIIDINDLHFDETKNEVLINDKPVKDAKWNKTKAGYQFKQSFPDDGEYEVIVRSEDFAGNKAVEKKHKFTVDNEKPKISIEKVEDGKYYDKNQTAAIKVNELNFKNNHVEITVNDKPYEWKNQGVESSVEIPFNNDGDYVIKVSAKDAAGNIAEPQEKKITIDKSSPALKITGVEHMTNYNVDKQASFEVTDANIDQTSIRVTKNGKAYNVGTPEQSRTKASLKHAFKEEGSYVLYFNATDKSGNKTTHDEIAFIIDKTNPVVKIDGVDHQSFNPTGKRVTVSVDELNFGTNYVVLSVTKDGKVFNIGTWQNNNKLSSLGYNFNDDGLYTVAISAEDKAGNGPIAANKTFTIDTTKPTIEITGVENAAHYNVDKPVSVAIRDVNLDVNRITVTRNGRGYNAGGFAVANQTARLSHNFSQEGDYVINVEAIDKAGNQFTNQIAFTIDKTAPVITPKFKGQSRVIKDGEYINEVFTPEFALDQADDTIVSVTMNGTNVTGRIPTASLEMTYKFSVLARDKAGNESTIDISFILDTTKPTLNITGVIDGFFNKNQMPTVTYSDRYLDTSRTRVTLNGRPFVNGLQLSDEGDYILKAEIYDLANNVSSRTIVFTIDKTAPVIKFKEAISDKYFKESLLPELLIEDLNAYDIISQTLNGQPYNLGDPIEEEGKHVLFFEVKDKAGNIQQLSVEFIIDKTPPKVNFEGVKKNETYRDPVTLSISLDNPSDSLKSVKINGELFNGDVKEVNGTKVVTVTLSDINKYKVEVLAFDDAGNENNEIVEFEIVEKSVLVKFYENKTLFAGTMVGIVGAAAAGAVALRRSIIRRRDEKDM
ncbi:Ig-like domain-containing protein [Bacillus sp. 1P02SD]|uniref:Ig-like domain-containing protein n=1 Tax=Bacillus sp. 1P02SD TaxID=3132264 RepID=UPI0039A0B980